MLDPVNERSSVISASSPVSAYADSSASEASSAWLLKDSSVSLTALMLAGLSRSVRSRTSSSRPRALASSAWPRVASSRAMPVCDLLERPLDRVERLARQGGLGGHGHRGGGAHDGCRPQDGGESAVAAIGRPDGEHEALFGGVERTCGLRQQRRVGFDHQPSAQVGDEVGSRCRLRDRPQVAHDGEQGGEILRILLRERTRDHRVELLCASPRRERPCHCCCPWVRRPLVATGRCPSTEPNDAVRTEVTRRTGPLVTGLASLPASTWRGCARHVAGAA